MLKNKIFKRDSYEYSESLTNFLEKVISKGYIIHSCTVLSWWRGKDRHGDFAKSALIIYSNPTLPPL